MVKNRIISLLLWCLFLFWAYSKDRLTREEHIEIESKRFAEAIGYDEFMQKFQRKLDADPERKKRYYMRKFEEAIGDE